MSMFTECDCESDFEEQADRISQLETEVERLRGALQFYADPKAVVPEDALAGWNDAYPGGIVYEVEGGAIVLDTGQIARQALDAGTLRYREVSDG